MSKSYLLGECPNLFDPDTGEWLGVVDRSGKETIVVTARLDQSGSKVKSLSVAGRDPFSDIAFPGYAPAYTGFIATNGSVCDSTLAGANGVAAWSRTCHWARDDIRDAQIVFGNFYVNSGGAEVAGNGSLTMTASIEYPEGTFTQVKWNGEVSGTMAAGDILVSDASTAHIPRGAKFWVRQYFSSSAKSIHYMNQTNVVDSANGEAFNYSTSSLADPTMGGAMVDASGGGIIIRPLAIIGTTTRQSAIIFGDSRQAGTNEGAVQNGYGYRGTVAKIIGPKMAYSNCSRGGANANAFNGASTRQRQLIQFATHIFATHGINDINTGNDLSTVTTRLSDYWTLLSAYGKKLIAITLSPEGVTTTDAYATVANQTANARNSVRVGVNAVIRKASKPLDGFIEVADAVESARDSGKFNAPGFTADGTHETWKANSVAQYQCGVDAFL